jgi:hypothetical protein
LEKGGAKRNVKIPVLICKNCVELLRAEKPTGAFVNQRVHARRPIVMNDEKTYGCGAELPGGNLLVQEVV